MWIWESKRLWKQTIAVVLCLLAAQIQCAAGQINGTAVVNSGTIETTKRIEETNNAAQAYTIKRIDHTIENNDTVQIKEEELYARSACLMDADSGRILFEKNGYEQMAMASTTKIMTCILALENGNWDDWVTVSDYAASQPKVHMGANAGEEFALGDLLYALMLESYNDVAVMIAEHIDGSVEQFAKRMNQKAKELGCKQTHFVTPNGLDAEDGEGKHSTTAADLARIMRYCIMQSPKKELFLEITGAQSYSLWNKSRTRLNNCTNHNAFLQMMDGAISGKTGFTNDAGYCYVGAVQWEGKTLIVSLLACGWPNNKGYKWADTRKLMLYGLQNYTYCDVFEPLQISPIPVEDGQYPGLAVDETAFVNAAYVPEDTQELRLLMREDEVCRLEYELPSKLEAPVTKGEKIGTVTYRVDDMQIAQYDLVADRSVYVRDFNWSLSQVLNKYRCFCA